MSSVLESPLTMQESEPKLLRPPDLSAAGRLWCHRRMLGKLAAIGFVAAGLLALALPNEYQSTVQIMPPDINALSGVDMFSMLAGTRATLPPTGGLASSLMKSVGETFIGILRSRTVGDALINRFDLRRVYRTKRYVDARTELASRTSAVENTRNGIITITVTDRDPNRAREIAVAYVEELNRLVAQLSSSSARRERIFLEARLKDVKEGLDAAALSASQFSSRTATLDIEQQGKAMVDATARLQGEIIAAQSELRSVETIYAGNNVRVRSLQARILELQRQLQKIGGTDDESEASLAAGQLYPSIRKLPLLGLTYTDLLRRVKVEESVFEILTKQYEIAKVQEAKEIPVVKVLDEPDLPERKSSPHRLWIAAAGMLVGLISGCLWILAPVLWATVTEDDEPEIVAESMRSLPDES